MLVPSTQSLKVHLGDVLLSPLPRLEQSLTVNLKALFSADCAFAETFLYCLCIVLSLGSVLFVVKPPLAHHASLVLF